MSKYFCQILRVSEDFLLMTHFWGSLKFFMAQSLEQGALMLGNVMSKVGENIERLCVTPCLVLV